MNTTDVTVPIAKLPLPSNQTESPDDDNGIETIKSYMTVAVVPLVIILLSITVALLSWAFSDRCFISIFMVLLSIINLFFAFVHVFAWNSPIMMTVPFFLASAAMGLLLQIVVGIARCVTSCLKYDEAYLSFSTFFYSIFKKWDLWSCNQPHYFGRCSTNDDINIACRLLLGPVLHWAAGACRRT